MKCVLAFVCLFAAIIFVAARPEEKYTTKYDDIDIDGILNNERLLKQYHECLMERGKCTKEGIELKKVIRDALERGCDLCSEKQQQGARKVFRFLSQNHQNYFDELKAKYDPEGKYIEKYREEAKKEGVQL